MRHDKYRFLLFGLTLCVVNLGQQAVARESASDRPQRFEKAIQDFEHKNYKASRKLLEELVDEEPSNALYWFNLGNAYFKEESFDDAALSYAKGMKLKTPLAPLCHIYLIKALRNDDELQRAYAEWENLKKDPIPSELQAELDTEERSLREKFVQLGLSQYKDKDYTRSLKSFDQALKVGAEYPETYLFKGYNLFYLRLIQQSRVAFTEVLSRNPDSNDKQSAEYFLEKIKEVEAEGYIEGQRPYWFFVDTAGGYNSNVFYDGSSTPKTAKPVIDSTVGAGYHLAQRGHFSMRIGGVANYNENVGASSTRSTSLSVPFHMVKTFSSWQFDLSPAAQYQTYGERFISYLFKPSGTLRIQKSWLNDDLYISYRFTRAYALNNAYHYLDGKIHSFKIGADWNSSAWKFGTSLHGVLTQAGDQPIGTSSVLPYSNRAFGPSFDLDWFPVYWFGANWTADYSYKTYDHVAQPGAKRRKDHNLQLGMRLDFRLSPYWRAYLSSNYELNRSTLKSTDVTDENYRQLISLLGVTWDIVP